MAWMCVMLCSLHGEPESNAWQSPDAATLKYLGELLRKNEPGITDRGVTISCSMFPVELLLDEELLQPKYKFRSRKDISISCVFQFPNGCKYLSTERRDDYGHFPMSFSEASTDTVRAHVTIFEVTRHDDNLISVSTTIIEAEYHDQCDANLDGIWDRKTCWTVLNAKPPGYIFLTPAARRK